MSLLIDRIEVNPSQSATMKKADYYETAVGAKFKFKPDDVTVVWRV